MRKNSLFGTKIFDVLMLFQLFKHSCICIGQTLSSNLLSVSRLS